MKCVARPKQTHLSFSLRIGMLALPVRIELYRRSFFPGFVRRKSFCVSPVCKLQRRSRRGFSIRRCFSSHQAVHPALEKKAVAQHTRKRKSNTRETARCAEKCKKQSCNRRNGRLEGQTVCARVHSLFQNAKLRRGSI